MFMSARGIHMGINLRGAVYFAYLGMRGSAIPRYYREYLDLDSRGPSPDMSRQFLARLLRHCREQVPYYSGILKDLPDTDGPPEDVLCRMPLLEKHTIRERFSDLRSKDVDGRHWHLTTSGGSTGEPVRLLQDQECWFRGGALALAYSRWVGHEIGEPEVRLWGSEREVLEGTQGLGIRVANALTRTTFLNAFRMTPEAMRGFALVLRKTQPKLILAYAQALYELAGFLESEGIQVPPAGAVITSAGTLHEPMRRRIERVFRCKVYNRYGSREVGLIAGERPGVDGLWVAPWNVIIEVVDQDGRPVPPGTDGEILVTSLVNYSMPLLRYRIGDRGVLAPGGARGGQILSRVLGRNVDAFRRRDGTLVDGEYFTHLLYFRDWVEKFQFVQTTYEEVLLRIVSRTAGRRDLQPELDQIAEQAKAALGPETVLRVEWVDEIQPAPSGKYRYTMSLIDPPTLKDQ
jgi:phenylacetate-CoA ligase